MMSDWSCRCSAKNGERDRYCEGCGAENPKAPVRHLAPTPKVSETHAPARLPDHREPTPEEDREIRATLATLKNSPWWRTTQGTAALPTVDPAIRAEVARRSDEPQRLADLLAAELKGARR